MPSEDCLSAYTVVVTRAQDRAAELTCLLQKENLNFLACPAIQINRSKLSSASQRVLAELGNGEFAWLIFTSPNGVSCLAEMQREAKQEPSLPAGLKVAVQGQGTARRLQEVFGRKADLIPEHSMAEALLASLLEKGLAGKRVLLATAKEVRDLLAAGLNQAGGLVERLVVYETESAALAPEALKSLLAVDPERVVFTFFSPSAFQGILSSLKDAGAVLQRAKIVTIGPITSEAVRQAGFSIFAEAEDPSDAGLIKVLRSRLV